jgi:hypothetical protein
MSNNIGNKQGSKEQVAQTASYVASITSMAGLTEPHRVIVASDLTVDQLMQAAFFNGRTPRSPEYKAGTRMALEHRIERADIVPPYQAGTAAADAFFAGLDEGKSIWRAAVAKIGGAA